MSTSPKRWLLFVSFYFVLSLLKKLFIKVTSPSKSGSNKNINHHIESIKVLSSY